MAKTNKRFQKKPFNNELAIFRNFLGTIEKQAQYFLNEVANPDLGDEYFRDALIALVHITTRVINKVKVIEKRLEEKGA